MAFRRDSRALRLKEDGTWNVIVQDECSCQFCQAHYRRMRAWNKILTVGRFPCSQPNIANRPRTLEEAEFQHDYHSTSSRDPSSPLTQFDRIDTLLHRLCVELKVSYLDLYFDDGEVHFDRHTATRTFGRTVKGYNMAQWSAEDFTTFEAECLKEFRR